MRRGGRKGGRCGKTTKKKYPIPFKKPIFTTFLTLLPSRPCGSKKLSVAKYTIYFSMTANYSMKTTLE